MLHTSIYVNSVQHELEAQANVSLKSWPSAVGRHVSIKVKG